MQWFNVERISAFLRLVSLIAALWSGGQAVQGYQVVASRPDGVASATGDDASLVGGNVALTGLLATLAMYRPAIAKLLTTLGVPDGATGLLGGVIDVGRLTQYWQLYSRAVSKAERDSLRTAASRVNDELFDTLFPPDKTETAK